MSAPAPSSVGRPTPFDRRSLIAVLVPLLIAYGAYKVAVQVEFGLDRARTPTLVGVALWVLYAAFAVWLVHLLQLFERRPPVLIAAAVSWGAFVAVGAAFSANASLEELIVRVGGPGLTESWGPALSAPLNEESLKVLGVIALALLPLSGVRSAMDGLIYGMFVGIGFQVAEDLVYGVIAATATNSVDGVITSFVTRGLVTGLFSHAVYAGITGAGIGYAASRTDRSWGRRLGVAAALFGVAVFFHFLWDSPLLGSMDGSAAEVTLGIVVKGLPMLAFLLAVMGWASRDKQRAFAQFSAEQVAPELLSEAERDDLTSHRSRRRARRAARAQRGRPAMRAVRRLQHAQVDLVQALWEEGAGSPRAARAGERIRAARERLDALPPRRGAAIPAGGS